MLNGLEKEWGDQFYYGIPGTVGGVKNERTSRVFVSMDLEKL